VWCGGITGEAATLQITKIIENGGKNSIWRENKSHSTVKTLKI